MLAISAIVSLRVARRQTIVLSTNHVTVYIDVVVSGRR